MKITNPNMIKPHLCFFIQLFPLLNKRQSGLTSGLIEDFFGYRTDEALRPSGHLFERLSEFVSRQ